MYKYQYIILGPMYTVHIMYMYQYIPNVMDLEHFIEIFLARRSNQVPSLCPPLARLEKVFDFCIVFISMLVMVRTVFNSNNANSNLNLALFCFT